MHPLDDVAGPIGPPLCRDGARMAMLRRNIACLQRLLGIVIIVVIVIPIIVAVIIGRIADWRLVIIVVPGARPMQRTPTRGHRASGMHGHDDGKLAHAGGMRRF